LGVVFGLGSEFRDISVSEVSEVGGELVDLVGLLVLDADVDIVVEFVDEFQQLLDLLGALRGVGLGGHIKVGNS